MTDISASVRTTRLHSLDVFRGVTIAAMLLVNNAGDWEHVFSPLEHAQWDGCTLTDMIFPFFLFIVGAAISFSLGSQLEKGTTRAVLIRHILRRTIILFGLGLFLNLISLQAFPDVEYFRPMGVLQRIAICYLVASILSLWQSPRSLVFWFIGLCMVYWLLMTLVYVPGHGRGILTIEGNLSSYIDTHLLGAHNYKYNADTKSGHDPEGLLSTLPAIASTISGCLAGWWLRMKKWGPLEKVKGLITVGALLVVVGYAWNMVFPFNKNLWTSSYVQLTSGYALIALGFCYWLVDIRGCKWWTQPFTVFGMNAITAYVGASTMAYTSIWIKVSDTNGTSVFLKKWVYSTLYASWIPRFLGDYVSSAAYGLSYVFVWCGIMWYFYKRKIFLKV